MTLDVIIGKLAYTEGDYGLGIEECPLESYDVCDPEYTMYPRRANRSGSTGFWDFFFDHVGNTYMWMRNCPDSNGPEVVALKEFIDEINALPDNCNNLGHNDRMKWFKFWCNRAVELYGDEAGIKFC